MTIRPVRYVRDSLRRPEVTRFSSKSAFVHWFMPAHFPEPQGRIVRSASRKRSRFRKRCKPVIAARIDQLILTDKTLLLVAAAIGNEVPYELLRAVADLDEDALHAALRRLQASEFLIETSRSWNVSYRFKHALTNDVAYGTLLQQTRRGLHARIMAALEQQHAGRLDEHVDALAYHATRGDVLEKAARYGRRAGFKAAARAANRAAIAHFGEALRALSRLPETPARMTDESISASRCETRFLSSANTI